MTNYIWITTQKEGYHYWKNAPKEVSFLKNVHRHIFHFRVAIAVKHNDRDIEFFMFKNDVKYFIDVIWGTNFMFDKERVIPLSCEMIADKLNILLQEKYGNRSMIIEISEDKENGCVMNY